MSLRRASTNLPSTREAEPGVVGLTQLTRRRLRAASAIGYFTDYFTDYFTEAVGQGQVASELAWQAS